MYVLFLYAYGSLNEVVGTFDTRQEALDFVNTLVQECMRRPYNPSFAQDRGAGYFIKPITHPTDCAWIP